MQDDGRKVLSSEAGRPVQSVPKREGNIRLQVRSKVRKKWAKIHVWICQKLGLISIYEFAPVVKDLLTYCQLNHKDIGKVISYIDTFAGMQHLLNKKLCKKTGMDPIDVTEKKEKDDVGRSYG